MSSKSRAQKAATLSRTRSCAESGKELQVRGASEVDEREADRTAGRVVPDGAPRQLDWSFSRVGVGAPPQRKCDARALEECSRCGGDEHVGAAAPPLVREAPGAGNARDPKSTGDLEYTVDLPDGARRLSSEEFAALHKQTIDSLRRQLNSVSEAADRGRRVQENTLNKYQGSVGSLGDLVMNPSAAYGIAADVMKGITPPYLGMWSQAQIHARRGSEALDQGNYIEGVERLRLADRSYRDSMSEWNKYLGLTIGGAEEVEVVVTDVAITTALAVFTAAAAPVLIAGMGAAGGVASTVAATAAVGAGLGGGGSMVKSRLTTGKIDWDDARAQAIAFGKQGAVTGLTAGLGSVASVASKALRGPLVLQTLQQCAIHAGINLSAELMSGTLEWLQDSPQQAPQAAPVLPGPVRAVLFGCLNGIAPSFINMLPKPLQPFAAVATNMASGYADGRVAGKDHASALGGAAVGAFQSILVPHPNPGSGQRRTPTVPETPAPIPTPRPMAPGLGRTRVPRRLVRASRNRQPRLPPIPPASQTPDVVVHGITEASGKAPVARFRQVPMPEQRAEAWDQLEATQAIWKERGIPQPDMSANMDLPTSMIHEKPGSWTVLRRINIGYNAAPAKNLELVPLADRANAALTARAAISHEATGHYEALIAGRVHPVHEETQASLRAAIHAPMLDRNERSGLISDAVARLGDYEQGSPSQGREGLRTRWQRPTLVLPPGLWLDPLLGPVAPAAPTKIPSQPTRLLHRGIEPAEPVRSAGPTIRGVEPTAPYGGVQAIELDTSGKAFAPDPKPGYGERSLGPTAAGRLNVYRGAKPLNQVAAAGAPVFGEPSTSISGTGYRGGSVFKELNAAELSAGRLRLAYDLQAGRPRRVEYEVHTDVITADVETDRRFGRDISTEGAQSSDAAYRNSGYERGHLAQREAFKGDRDVEKAIDHWTNIVPMTVSLNRGAGSPWRAAETRTINYVRPKNHGGEGLSHVRVIVEPVYDINPSRLSDGTPIPKSITRTVLAPDGRVLEAASFLNR